ncbi:MAG: glycosyltransferase [Phycisphaeraceae bacterium]
MGERLPVIAHVLHRLYLAGAEVLAADLSRRLRDRYRFVFLCLDEVGPLGEKLRGEGFDVRDLGRRPGVDMSVSRRLRRAARELGVDLMHAHQYTPFFYAAMSRMPPAQVLPGGRPPILFTEHGRHYPDYRRPKRVLANKVLLRRGDRVTAVGHWVKQCLIDNEGISAQRIQVVHNGIDPRKFDTSQAHTTRQRMRHDLHIAPEQAVILQVARFHPVKDHATAIRAFAKVMEHAPAGGASGRSRHAPLLLLAGDGEKRDECEALANQLHVGVNVRFLGVRSDVADLLAAADVFLLSSLSEGISVTLLEAMAASLPIVATAVGGNGEVVEHGQTGLLAPRGDADGLAAHLVNLLSHTELRRQMGATGRQRLLAMFTEERMHGRYAAIYAQMLSK